MQPFLKALFVKWGQGVKGRLIFFPKIHPFWYTDPSLSKHFRRSSNQKTKINGNIVGIQAVAVNNEKPENVNKEPQKHKSAACVCQQGEVKCGRCPPSIHPPSPSSPPSLLLSHSSLSVSSSHSCVPATPTYKESICSAAKMEIDTFSTTTISFLFVCYVRFLNEEVCVLIAKEKVVSWLGQVR